ncbi:MAG: SDR family oxidoreductase [Acidobacteria bacterium]|nr:SDR family oxidoreductase [Acidobacteriota bacterium]
MTDTTARRTALITGASAGIGLALAEVFARHGFDLVLTARRADRLQAISADLATRFGCRVHTIAADLADPAAPARIYDDVAKAGITVDALVNNAGYGLPGLYVDTAWDQQRDFLQVMVTAVAELAHRFMPGMVQRGYGRIINVASLAGLVPWSAGHTLYGASKALLIKFSESLALEGLPHNVHVTALCPGFTYSEFHDVNGTRPLVSQLPRWMFMNAQIVAEQAYDAVMAGKSVYVNGRINRAIAQLVRYAPQWLVRGQLRRVARKFRKV